MHILHLLILFLLCLVCMQQDTAITSFASLKFFFLFLLTGDAMHVCSFRVSKIYLWRAGRGVNDVCFYKFVGASRGSPPRQARGLLRHEKPHGAVDINNLGGGND